MDEVILTGDLLFPHGVEEATIGIGKGRIEYVDKGTVSRDGRKIEGLIVPGLIDMHTHLGDNGARGYLPQGLDQVVLPGGIKHKFLSGASAEERIHSISSSISEVSPGVSHILDFREGGIEGIRLLQRSLVEGMPEVHPMGRPAEDDDQDMLIEISSGIGMPSLDGDLLDIRHLCKKKNKPFSLHASELYREDTGILLDLRPDLVIHMIAGTHNDWVELAESGIPVAVCPRANSAYSLEVPIQEMASAGLALGLGTDNAISVKQDMFREMEAAWILMRKGGLEGQEASRLVFQMAAGMTMKDMPLLEMIIPCTMWWDRDWPARGDRADLFVLEGRFGYDGLDPFSRIVRFSGQKDVIWSGP